MLSNPRNPTRRRIRRFIRRLVRDRSGTFAVELAMAAPILAALAVGGVEITRFVLLNQKIERTSATMADLVSQSETLSEQSMTQLFLATSNVMAPFEIDTEGRLIVSSVSATGGNPPQINWQRVYGAPGSSSQIGNPGGAALLPQGFTMTDGDSVIVAEVFYDFEPLFTADLIDPVELYNLAMYRPRFGSLNTILP